MRAYISFCGFYNSELSPDFRLESIRDSQAYDLSHYNGFTDDEVTAYFDACMDAFDFREYAKKVGACYCEYYETMLQNLDNSLENVKLNFSQIYSPKEYNFYTDSCEVEISEDDLRKILAFAYTVRNADDLSFAEYIAECMKPCSGFIPFYSQDVNEWGDISTWSCAQLKCLFNFVLPSDDVVCDENGLISERLMQDCEELACENDPDADEWLKEYRANKQ